MFGKEKQQNKKSKKKNSYKKKVVENERVRVNAVQKWTAAAVIYAGEGEKDSA